MVYISTKSSISIIHCREELKKIIQEKQYNESKLVSILETLDLIIQEFPKKVDVCVLCKDTKNHGT